MFVEYVQHSNLRNSTEIVSKGKEIMTGKWKQVISNNDEYITE